MEIEIEEYDFNSLDAIREQIEAMSKFNQIEVLKILIKHKEVIINENKYGIHVNLSDVSNEILNELLLYIKYVNTQEMYLSNVEKEKEVYKNTFFIKGNKDIYA